jgi:hypothetical protein
VGHSKNTELPASTPPPIQQVDDQPSDGSSHPAPAATGADQPEDSPPWAVPLRAMYQQVVEEPLPDFLAELIQKLDQEGQ